MDNKILDRYRQMMGVSHGYTYEYFDYLEHTGRGEYIILPYHPNEKTNLKFISRFQMMEKLAGERNLQLADLSIEQMDELWDEAKKMK